MGKVIFCLKVISLNGADRGGTVQAGHSFAKKFCIAALNQAVAHISEKPILPLRLSATEG
ncbi:hypothetical protein [Shinella sp.]|uniref:hypothetical protein n=1 Tax=Shinella sp. TaxID=1870904 RepID=UPI0028AB5E28|nr:hypothetical protein [Shinella sp.]